MNRFAKKSKSMLDFWKTHTLEEVNSERRDCEKSEVDRLTFVIDGLNQCYQADALLSELFDNGAGYQHIKTKLAESGSTALLSDNDEEIIEYLIRCLRHGNNDVSIYDMHRRNSVLLYVTWTNGGSH